MKKGIQNYDEDINAECVFFFLLLQDDSSVKQV